MGEVLSRPLIQILRQYRWPVDLVTAVPTGIARRRERGYNQAALVAWPVAYGCSMPFKSRALVKSRETRSQVGLNRLERRQNVEMAYLARSELVAGKKLDGLPADRGNVVQRGHQIEGLEAVGLAAGVKMADIP